MLGSKKTSKLLVHDVAAWSEIKILKFPPPWASGLLNPSESITIPLAKFKDEVRGSAKPKESNHKVVNGPIPPIIESTSCYF